MISGESLAPIGPSFRYFAQRGEIEIVEIDEHMYYQGLRAAAALMPSLPWRGGIGTDYAKAQSAAQGVRRSDHRRAAAGDPLQSTSTLR